MEHVLAKTILIAQTTELIAKKYKLSLEEARDRFYKSNIVELLDDDETAESAFNTISTAIARKGGELTAEEKNQLIALLIGRTGDVQKRKNI